ncbi:MAG: hypothetical protein QS748_01900 [Candidatus Endonucleobacter bathymodioli]|uniref:Uncharacterized protein n=1 Tax=Candidatus Endonucleibacter bathymodioli TaxID=539814 RepID=A0AA90NJT3_9GAMM|nr:hypothetical protein [Candidatus Endonucleobacter bathymodioli]
MSSEEAIRALKTSTDPVRCILSPVWLKNTENGSTCELDFQRYNISVEVGHDSGCGNEGSKILDWYDIGVNITMAAPGCGTISGKSGWALDLNRNGAFIKSNTLVGGRTNVNTTGGMRLYAKLAIIGCKFRCASYDKRHLAFGDLIDTNDSDGNSSILFGSIDGDNAKTYKSIKSTCGEVTRMPDQLVRRFTSVGEKEIDQMVVATSSASEIQRDATGQASRALQDFGFSARGADDCANLLTLAASEGRTEN